MKKDSSKKKVDWKKELARDFLALGSWVFFALVISRILILPYRWDYLTHLLIAGGLIFLADLFLRGKIDTYVSRALVITFYTSWFYDNNIYGIFVKLIFAGLVFSSSYVGNSWKKIIYGLLLGTVGVGLKFIVG
jgi:hypothetical protein